MTTTGTAVSQKGGAALKKNYVIEIEGEAFRFSAQFLKEWGGIELGNEGCNMESLYMLMETRAHVFIAIRGMLQPVMQHDCWQPDLYSHVLEREKNSAVLAGFVANVPYGLSEEILTQWTLEYGLFQAESFFHFYLNSFLRGDAFPRVLEAMVELYIPTVLQREITTPNSLPAQAMRDLLATMPLTPFSDDFNRQVFQPGGFASYLSTNLGLVNSGLYNFLLPFIPRYEARFQGFGRPNLLVAESMMMFLNDWLIGQGGVSDDFHPSEVVPEVSDGVVDSSGPAYVPELLTTQKMEAVSIESLQEELYRVETEKSKLTAEKHVLNNKCNRLEREQKEQLVKFQEAEAREDSFQKRFFALEDQYAEDLKQHVDILSNLVALKHSLDLYRKIFGLDPNDRNRGLWYAGKLYYAAQRCVYLKGGALPAWSFEDLQELVSQKSGLGFLGDSDEMLAVEKVLAAILTTAMPIEALALKDMAKTFLLEQTPKEAQDQLFDDLFQTDARYLRLLVNRQARAYIDLGSRDIVYDMLKDSLDNVSVREYGSLRIELEKMFESSEEIPFWQPFTLIYFYARRATGEYLECYKKVLAEFLLLLVDREVELVTVVGKGLLVQVVEDQEVQEMDEDDIQALNTISEDGPPTKIVAQNVETPEVESAPAAQDMDAPGTKVFSEDEPEVKMVPHKPLPPPEAFKTIGDADAFFVDIDREQGKVAVRKKQEVLPAEGAGDLGELHKEAE